MKYRSKMAFNQTGIVCQPTCHSELQLCHLKQWIKCKQMLKRVQHDRIQVRNDKNQTMGDKIRCFPPVKEPVTASTPPPRTLSLTNRAFTLAEVLIVLVILGIVAIITVPSMINNYQEKNTVVRVKKAFSTLSNAYGLVLTQDGPPEGWNMQGMYDTESHIILANAFKKHISVAIDCVGKSQAYTKANCSAGYSDIASYASFVAKDGSAFIFRTWGSTCLRQYGSVKNVCGELEIDVNGLKPPNKIGHDVFPFYFTADQIIPMGVSGDEHSFDTYCDRNVTSNIVGFAPLCGCTAWVLYNENMDYLHCDDLSWDGKRKCK